MGLKLKINIESSLELKVHVDIKYSWQNLKNIEVKCHFTVDLRHADLTLDF